MILVLLVRSVSSLIELGLATISESTNDYDVKKNHVFVINKSKHVYNVMDNRLQLQNSDKILKFIDLLAGIGGIRKGFEDKSTKCVFSWEWDKYISKTYEANYGEKPHGDITKIDEKDIPNHDVLLAEFPCQPFSNIGKREGFDHETQGTLFFDVLRILKEKQPKMFLLENVKGLLTNDNGETFRIIKVKP